MKAGRTKGTPMRQDTSGAGVSRSRAADEIGRALERGAARRLDDDTRAHMEQRLGHRFDRVRVHVEGAGAQATATLGARAFTFGQDIAFAPGTYRPATAEGRALIAHELAHVAQQAHPGARAGAAAAARHEGEARRAALAAHPVALSPVAGPVLQMDKPEQKAPTQAAPQAPRILTVIIRAPDDKFTQDVSDYVRNTLNDPNVLEVDNLGQVFQYLDGVKKTKGPKIAGIRLVAHGSTTGGISMRLKGETTRRFVTAQELEKMATDANLPAIASSVMEQDATVEFWGCYVARSDTATTALSTMFGAEFRSLEGELKTGFDAFARPAEKGENGPQAVTSSQEVDDRAKRNPNLKKSFEKWLLARHQTLAANGDITPQASREDQLKAMRELFDRSRGRIRQLVIQDKNQVVQRKDKAWLKKWKSKKAGGSP
jgi:hypothetical protein